MRWVIAVLMQFGQGLNALHFNLRLALFGLIVCGMHTGAALVLLCRRMIPASTAEQIIDFSMSGTVFLLVGITVSGLIPSLKGKRHVEPHLPSDGLAWPDENLADRGADSRGAVFDRRPCLENAPSTGANDGPDECPS